MSILSKEWAVLARQITEYVCNMRRGGNLISAPQNPFVNSPVPDITEINFQ